MSRYHPLWAAPTQADLETGSAAVEKARSAHALSQREADYIQAIEAFYRIGKLLRTKTELPHGRGPCDWLRPNTRKIAKRRSFTLCR